MIKQTLERLNLDLYSEKLPNGLEVYVVPKSNVNGIYATFSTKYGSNDIEFVPRGEISMKKFPLGIAHFLEHKMFENEDMKDPFTYYTEHGCDANANTSNLKTTYLFSGTSSVEENLNFLLDYVQKPYFTDKNVEKEKGIIAQEIKMYDDDPYSKLYYGLLYNVFNIHPYKYKVGGDIEDIKKITKENLYSCYETFYHPSNMYLVVTGSVDPKEVIETVKANQKTKKFSKPEEINIKKYDEPNKVFKEYEEVNMDIELPKLGIAYKFNFPSNKKSMKDLKTYLGLIFNTKLGPTSLLNEKLKDEHLIDDDLDYTLIDTDKHIVLMIFIESKELDKVVEEISEELKDISISEEDFNRKIKNIKSSCIYASDNIYSINSKIMNNIINYNKVILDDFERLDSFKYKTLQSISKKIKFNNKSTYKINKS